MMSRGIEEAVRERYGAVATSNLSSEHGGVRAVAEAFGYTAEELRSIPAEANMGLSCGNPTATAGIREGEVVVDLGSGGGLDVFLAATKVGPSGKSIGIDMTPEMIELARRNDAKRLAEGAPANVEFHLATIDALPLSDASVDCVISNCVINLAPDKPAVFREIARVLKPGGRLAASDIALKRDLPPAIGSDLMAYVGCIAGAIPIAEYRQGLLDAGFSGVEIVDGGSDLNAYAKIENQSGCCSPAMTTIAAAGETSGLSIPPLPAASGGCAPAAPATISGGGSPAELHEGLADLLRRYDVNDYAASVKVYAVKGDGTAGERQGSSPAASGCCAPGCCDS